MSQTFCVSLKPILQQTVDKSFDYMSIGLVFALLKIIFGSRLKAASNVTRDTCVRKIALDNAVSSGGAAAVATPNNHGLFGVAPSAGILNSK